QRIHSSLPRGKNNSPSANTVGRKITSDIMIRSNSAIGSTQAESQCSVVAFPLSPAGRGGGGEGLDLSVTERPPGPPPPPPPPPTGERGEKVIPPAPPQAATTGPPRPPPPPPPKTARNCAGSRSARCAARRPPRSRHRRWC